MRVITRIPDLRRVLAGPRRRGRSVGFVPTMGKLHDGHLSLIRRCRRDHGVAVVSIFVNPKQFGPGEDYRAYPRDKKKDIFLSRRENVDIIFCPSEKTMYPGRSPTAVEVGPIARVLCGRSRPGHFRGVATVVAKLLNVVGPDVIYLGQKDAQQCLILRQMIRDLDFPVRVKVMPTVREHDGLAMSSRNAYLSPRQRQDATVLYRSLMLARQKIRDGERRAGTIQRAMRSLIGRRGMARVDYVACVDAETLRPVNRLKGTILIALAVYYGRARLIDNVLVRV